MTAITTGGNEVELKIVGSSVFGRYPFVNPERTINMYISDNAMVNFSGYRNVLSLLETHVEGRGFYKSTRGGFAIAVAGGNVYRINDFDTSPILLGTISTTEGSVFIAENLSSQIAMVDGANVYIYNYETLDFGLAVFAVSNPDLIPNYIDYHNTYFLFGNGITTNAGSQWFVYKNDSSDPLGIEIEQTLTLQTKADFAKAVKRIPGKGNNVAVIGLTVMEIWNNVGGLAVYQRVSSINIDYGLASVSTLAASDEIVAWLGINENSEPSIQVMAGGSSQRISTDGIDFLLAEIVAPQDSTAFFFRQDGHLFYVLTFYNDSDNKTVMYDFNTNKFFELTDWDNTYFPVRQVINFIDGNYFISLKDAKIYLIDTKITVYQTNEGEIYEVPRIRICPTFRLPKPDPFRVGLITFTIESGTQPYVPELCQDYIIAQEGDNVIIYTEVDSGDGPMVVQQATCDRQDSRIDLYISKNGGVTFSNPVPYYMRKTGFFDNQPRFMRMGKCNQFTAQFRFWGFWRFIITNAVMEITL